MGVTKQQQVGGLSDIHRFILNKSPRSLADLIETTYKLNEAPEKVERKNKERMKVVMDFIKRERVERCSF